MISIFINKKNNRIAGYNNVVNRYDVVDPDKIIIDDPEKERVIKNGIRTKNLFYINGNILENDTDDWKTREEKDLEVVNEELSILEMSGKDEYESFMKDLINTASFDAAIENAKQKAAKREELKGEKIALEETIRKAEEKAEQKWIKKSVPTTFKYFLSGITVVRDEDEYLLEWLRYHIEEIGFDHFYIYDNESKTPVNEFLEGSGFKYPEKITVIEWPTDQTQNLQEDANNHFLLNFRKESKWIINFDVDEYVSLSEDLAMSLIDFLKKAKQPYFTCRWRWFGANGLENKMPGTDMERFTKESEPMCEKEARNGKQFVQSAKIAFYMDHVPSLRRSFLNEMPNDINWTTNVCRDDIFRLNHYFTRSYEEWVDKMKNKGSVNPSHGRNFQDFFKINPDMEYLNTGENYKQQYSPQRKDDENGNF